MTAQTPAPVTVLLVDDEPDVLELTATYLERVDDELRTVTAAGAADGLDVLSAKPVDCVVSDYDMPHVDGLEFLRQVRNEYPDLPFILFTGRGSEEIASEAISAGVTDYLQKSAGNNSYEMLANRIRNAVDRATAQHRAASLARVNDLIRKVQAGLVRAETPDEIQRVVCETLTNAEPYMLAWFGVPSETTQTVESVAVAGDAAEFVEELTVRFDDSPHGQGPGGRAVRTREPQVINDTMTDSTVDAWREDVDRYGIESLIVLPLINDGHLHGILPVYADRPDAFDAEERAVLTELADTIAAALTAADDRRRLERYETIINAVDDPIYVTNADGTIAFASESLATLLGYDHDELIGMHVSQMLSADDIERIERHLRELVSSGGIDDSFMIELAVERADGTTVECEDHISLLPSDGTFEGTAGILRDISDRVTDKEARQELYEVGADRDNDFITIARKALRVGRDRLGVDEGKLIEFDTETDRHETIATATDRSLEGELKPLSDTYCKDVVGRDLVAIHDTSANEQADADARDQLGHGCYIGAEVRVDETLFGSVCFVDADRRTEFTDRERSFVELVARTLGYELSNRHERERAARREAVLRQLHREVAVDRPLRETIDAVLDLGRETLDTAHGVVSHIEGDRYEMEFTVSPHEITEPGTVFDLDTTACVVTLRNESITQIGSMDDAEPWSNLPIHTDIGMQCYIGTPLIVDGEVYGTLCFLDAEARAEPFSEWEETLVELMGLLVARLLGERTNQQLLERERDRLEEFASTISHDLRTPLAVAAGRIDLARTACDCGEGDESLATASKAIERAETLIEETLMLARQGEIVGETQPVPLEEAVTDAYAGLDHNAATLDMAGDLSTIEADPDRLHRLLENVFRNSLEHAGPAVTISVDWRDSTLCLCDDGPGIPAQQQEAAFERGRSTSETNTGFGLSIVREIAEAHGWSVRATDSATGGTCIEVTGIDADG